MLEFPCIWHSDDYHWLLSFSFVMTLKICVYRRCLLATKVLRQAATFCPPRFRSIIGLLHVRYWFTHLTKTTERVVERDLAQVIRVLDRYQTKPVRPPPPNVTNQPYTSPFPQSNTGAGGYGQYHGNYTFSLEPVDELLLDF